jgi:hypothetical protein
LFLKKHFPILDALSGGDHNLGPYASRELSGAEMPVCSRAAGVNSSLDRLQQQQNAYGLGLCGDMAEKQG